MKAQFAVLVLLTVAVTTVPAQSRPSDGTVKFVLDPNRPYVYLLFDHLGKGPRFTDDEPKSRIWFRLVNNCRVPITVQTFGVPVGSKRVEVGVMHDVVANAEPTRIVGIPSEESRPEAASRADNKHSVMPRGYHFDLSSSSVILPQESLLFSIPTNHLSKRWHIEIPYEFELPAGKCCRAENVGGEPRMVLSYSEWYLPDKVKQELENQD